MDLLLDTHALLWFLAGDANLPPAAREAISDPRNEARVSVASLWEITIKHSMGKLVLGAGLEQLFKDAFETNGFERLPIERDHLLALSRIAIAKKPNGDEHRDPFDRLLLAQARAENLTLVTVETWWVGAYGAEVLWS